MNLLKLNIQMFAGNSASINTYSPASSTYPWVISTNWIESSFSNSDNTSTISISGSLYGKNISFSGSAGGTLEIWWYDNNEYINGVLVSSLEIIKTTIGTPTEINGSITVNHRSDGTLIGRSYVVWTKNANNSYVPNTASVFTADSELTRIARYAEITSFSAIPINETQVTLNWKTDSTIDYIWFSSNGGSTWLGTTVNLSQGGSLTISNLTDDTLYSFKIRVRRYESQLVRESQIVESRTYSYPYIISASLNITIGDKPSVTLYNPLGRSVYVFGKIGDLNGTAVMAKNSNSTSVILDYLESGIDNMYSSIPNSSEGNIYYTLSYETKDSSIVGKFNIDISNSYPTFDESNITYYDINGDVTAITEETGPNCTLVQGLSKMRISISPASAKNYATISKYVIRLGLYTEEIYNSGNIDITDSKKYLNFSSNQKLYIDAVDSRGYKTTAIKDIKFFSYFTPSITGSSKRLNNYGTIITYSLLPYFSYINGKNKYTITCTAQDEDYTFSTTIVSSSTSTLNITGQLDYNFLNDKSYVLNYKIVDSFNNESILPITVNVGTFTFFVDTKIKGVGINTFPTVEGIEIAGQSIISDGGWNRKIIFDNNFSSGYSKICSFRADSNYKGGIISFDLAYGSTYGSVKIYLSSSSTSVYVSSITVFGKTEIISTKNGNSIDIYIARKGEESGSFLNIYGLCKSSNLNNLYIDWLAETQTVNILPEGSKTYKDKTKENSYMQGQIIFTTNSLPPDIMIGGTWRKIENNGIINIPDQVVYIWEKTSI